MSAADSLAHLIATLDWEGDPGPAPLAGSDADRLRARLGDGATRWVAGATEKSLSALHARIQDALAPWPVIRSFAQHVLIATLLGFAGDKEIPAATEAIDHDLAADVVSRDVPLSDITEALRTVQREWLTLLIDAAVRLGREGVGVVPALATSVGATMDAWIGAATEAIVEERRRVYQAEQVRIRSTIESLVAAMPVDVESATRLLHIRLLGWHLGCAIGSPPGGTVERRVLEGVVQGFARFAGTDRMLRYETTAGTVHVWVTAERAPRTPKAEDLRVPSPLLVGIGEPHPGTDGFRRTFLEASDALHLAARLGVSGGVRYGDAALAILLSRDEERARWFVEQALGELAADTPEMADMRDTLRVFFDTRMRIAPAAERLFLHRNTLINRLERIQASLGHGVAERSAETQAALVIAELVAHVRETAIRPDS